MSKKSKKLIIKLIFITILFSLMLSSLPDTRVFAGPTQGIGPNQGSLDTSQVEGIVKKVLGVLMFLGMFLSVAMIIVVGVNYFTAAHNPEERSKVNKRMQSVIIGTVMIMGATGILTLIRNTITNVAS